MLYFTAREEKLNTHSTHYNYYLLADKHHAHDLLFECVFVSLSLSFSLSLSLPAASVGGHSRLAGPGRGTMAQLAEEQHPAKRERPTNTPTREEQQQQASPILAGKHISANTLAKAKAGPSQTVNATRVLLCCCC